MSVRNNKLGGIDWVNEHPTLQDLNETFDATIDSSAKGQAQMPFSILKSAGAFTNEGNLCAERTTDVNGANNTINTTDTDSQYQAVEQKYILKQKNTGVTESNSVTTSLSTTSSITTDNIGILGKGFFSSINFTTTTSTTIRIRIYKNNVLIAESSATNNGASTRNFALTDYSDILVPGDVAKIVLEVSPTNNYLRSIGSISFSGSLFTITTNITPASNTVGINPYTFTELESENSSNIVVDSDTLTLTGNENSIVLYNSAIIPDDTSIEVQLSDESKTISNKHVLSANNSIIIPLNQTPTADDTLKLTFFLATTDSAKTPEWFGFGAYRI